MQPNPADGKWVFFHRHALLLFCLIARVACGDLQTTVDSIVRASDLGGGSVSICILDVASGNTLAAINSNASMIPASNQKLLTSGTALHVLGPSFEFETTLLWDGKTLSIVGDGDPTFGDPVLLGVTNWETENLALDSELNPWVAAIQEADIEKIVTLVVDDRIFDRTYVHPTWPANQINNWYCAQVSGLNYHLNVVHFFPSPRSTGHADLGTISPHMPWLDIGNKTTSKRGKKDTSSFWVARTPNGYDMTARGNVRNKHTTPVKVAFHNPALVFGEVLARTLRSNGVPVANVEQVAIDAPLSKGECIFRKRTPLSVVLKRSNTDSYNLYAETLLKRVAAASTGNSGTFHDGAEAVQRSVAQRLGIHSTTVSPADGSGMSRNNKLSTHVLARWLASFNVQDIAGKLLLNSLATPEEGTLKNRFSNADLGTASVHAKSGYIRGVSALSGYVTSEDGRAIAFSIIVNDVTGIVRGAKKMQESIVEAIADMLN